ncbi:MAG: response regulator [Opitutaceae bacterium]|jgi:CheY-like chemotaxis protein
MKAKILLVEDNTESRYLFSYILKREGCDVVQATNGKHAIELADGMVPDLIIMDIQMPELDGYETATIMRKRPKLARVPIVGLSAFAMASDREKAFQNGFTGYIEKPIELATFVQEISAYLPSPAKP